MEEVKKMRKMTKIVKRLRKEEIKEEVSLIDQMQIEEEQKTNHQGDPDDAAGAENEVAVLMQGLTDQIFGNPVIQGKIFSYLISDPTAVKNASLVCRSWNSLLDKPKYWTWAEAELRRETFCLMFSSRRFRNIGSVIITSSLTGEQLEALCITAHIKMLLFRQ